MRLRNVKNAQDILNNCSFLINNPQNYKGDFKKLFGNNNPIHIEIGMGKGKFISSLAAANPNINYIGIEKMSSILARGIQTIEKSPLDNLKVMRLDALELADIFAAEIDRIYLNFSDPWPKNRHVKRRLTSHTFLKIYDKIFAGQKVIIQKTDNDKLFESSIEFLSTYGYILKNISLDLHKTDKKNYMTEYEEKFSKKGIKIKYLEAYKD